MNRRWLLAVLAFFLAVAPARALYEQEQLDMENQLRSSIEDILSRTLPAKSYLVTVKVEMEQRQRPQTRATSSRKTGNNSFLQNQYVLPGVPQKKEFVPAPETNSETTVNSFSTEALVKRILITILVAPDVSEDQIKGIRDVISSSIPFNPLRGDEMDIQNSPLLKSANAPASPSPSPNALGSAGTGSKQGGLWSSLSDRANAPMLVLLGAFSMALILLIAFLFGPVRAFLNRLLAVLPRIGEQAAYTVSNAPAKPTTTPGGLNPLGYSNGHGSNGSGEEDGTRPFRFIREDQLNKLPILFKGMSAVQCALVLAYLPAEWASKVLGMLDAGVQSAIMRELAQAREVPAVIVKDIEDQIKTKLPYLVGGVDWIQSVYQLTQPQTQRALLGTLNQQSPELAQELRKKTFFLEDLNVIAPGALRLLFQEVGLPTAALALKDEKPENREAVLRRLPVAMREILQQEFDLAGEDRNAIQDSKAKLLDAGRRLMVEGRIALPERR